MKWRKKLVLPDKEPKEAIQPDENTEKGYLEFSLKRLIINAENEEE